MKFTGKDGELRIYDAVGNYMKVHFSNMDFSGPIGRAKQDEMLILDRGIVDAYSHYITGNDQVVYDPIPLSWSCFIDDITHVDTTYGFSEILIGALTCRDGRNDQTDATWSTWGVSTKGSTSNDGSNPNPLFLVPGQTLNTDYVTAQSGTQLTLNGTYDDNYLADCLITFTSGAAAGKSFLVDTNTGGLLEMAEDLDSYGILVNDTVEVHDNHRTVDIQFKLTGEVNDIVWKLAEVYFPPEEITFTEAEDAINMAITGGIYGKITRHSDWA